MKVSHHINVRPIAADASRIREESFVAAIELAGSGYSELPIDHVALSESLTR